MAIKHNWRLIKLHRSYTVDEAARLLNYSKGTIRRWIKNGLSAISDQKPNLILGSDLHDFCQARKRPKQKCAIHELLCMHCKRPKQPAFGEVELIPMNSSTGNLRALCETCASVMCKRFSYGRLDELKAILKVTVLQGDEHIGDRPVPCLNDHNRKEP